MASTNPNPNPVISEAAVNDRGWFTTARQKIDGRWTWIVVGPDGRMADTGATQGDVERMARKATDDTAVQRIYRELQSLYNRADESNSPILSAAVNALRKYR